MIHSTDTHVGVRFHCTLSLILILASLLLFAPCVGAAGVDATVPNDLTELSIEDLLSMEVTSVSKRSEQLRDTASAVYVITREDIRRSGVTSIAEALRMAPGLEVAHIDANKWAISSRGFNDRWANKLLVLVDGRSVYTPTFSGVWWDAQDYLLEDIERIEVIRGPGATLWGANAVNGIINVITRNATDTEGFVASSMAGGEEQIPGQCRFGGRIGSRSYYRAYAKSSDIDNAVYASGAEATDAWERSQGGFRLDTDYGKNRHLTAQGDVYRMEGSGSWTRPILLPPYSQTQTEGVDVTGNNLLARWTAYKSENDETVIQAYFDNSHRHESGYHEKRGTFDVEYQRRFTGGSAHAITCGAGYRRTNDETESDPMNVALNPASQSDGLSNFFMQDDITLRDDRLRLTVGAKVEHNDYSGTEFQPGLRLLWTPSNKRTGWAAISRAVRTPSRVDITASIPYEALPQPPLPPALLVVTGNHDFKSERLLAYELGYRTSPSRKFSLDVAAFYNKYDRLRTYAYGGAPYFVPLPSPHIVVPLEIGNLMDGYSYGCELAARWNPRPNWHISANYTRLETKLNEDPATGSGYAEDSAGNNPRNQFHLRSYLDLGGNLEFDTMLYAIDKLPNLDIPAYTRLDLRLGWRPKGDFTMCVGVQNLLDDRHPEFGKSLAEDPSEVERTLYALVTWRR